MRVWCCPRVFRWDWDVGCRVAEIKVCIQLARQVQLSALICGMSRYQERSQSLFLEPATNTMLTKCWTNQYRMCPQKAWARLVCCWDNHRSIPCVDAFRRGCLRRLFVQQPPIRVCATPLVQSLFHQWKRYLFALDEICKYFSRSDGGSFHRTSLPRSVWFFLRLILSRCNARQIVLWSTENSSAISLSINSLPLFMSADNFFMSTLEAFFGPVFRGFKSPARDSQRKIQPRLTPNRRAASAFFPPCRTYFTTLRRKSSLCAMLTIYNSSINYSSGYKRCIFQWVALKWRDSSCGWTGRIVRLWSQRPSGWARYGSRQGKYVQQQTGRGGHSGRTWGSFLLVIDWIRFIKVGRGEPLIFCHFFLT